MTNHDATSIAVTGIEGVWEDLAGAHAPQSGILVRRLLPDSPADLFLGISKPDNQRMLVIPLDDPELMTEVQLPASRGVEVCLGDGAPFGTPSSLRLTQIDARFNPMFSSLVADVVRAVSEAPTAQDGAAAVVTRLGWWQRFLAKASLDALGRETQQGLYGELWFMRDRLSPCVGIGRSVLAWKGPHGAEQDFQFPTVSIEVKTTVSRQPLRVTITSERQLDNTGAPNLLLAVMSLDVREGGQETLVELISSLRQAATSSPGATMALEEALLEAGYIDIHESFYNRTSYALRSCELYCVREGFPRIVETTLMRGVGYVKYQVEVSQMSSFRVPGGALNAALTSGE